MNGYAGTINQFLGIKTSKIVNEGSATENQIYYESEYRNMNAENLQKLVEDTYAQAVLEEEEGAVLLKNENQALPLSPEERRVTLFGHATAQPLYKNASAGSKGYQTEHNINLCQALLKAGFSVNDTLFRPTGQAKPFWGTGKFDLLPERPA